MEKGGICRGNSTYYFNIREPRGRGMAVFKLKDWVCITPRPDKSWHYWNEDHDDMLNHKAEIIDMQSDPNEPSLSYYLVRTYMEDGTPLAENWFLEKHLMRTDSEIFNRDEHMKKICDDLQIWEAKKKKSLDDQLRHVFGRSQPKEDTAPRPKPQEKKKVSLHTAGDPDSVGVIYDPEDYDYSYEYDENSYYDNESYPIGADDDNLWNVWDDEDTKEVDIGEFQAQLREEG
jgi:hypothetical protein